MQVTLYPGIKTFFLFFLALLFGAEAYAQSNDSLVVFFLSEPGTRPSRIFADGFESGDLSRLDFNGDDKPELVLTREDADGALQGILVINAASLDTLWRVQDVQGLLTDDGTIVLFGGFADADADGTREAVFVTENEVLLVDPRDPQVINWRSSFNIGFPPELRLIAITDMTDDNFEEIVVALPQARQVVVFSDNPATAARR